MSPRGRSTAGRAATGRRKTTSTLPAPPGDEEEATMDQAEFDKVMRGLLAVPWNAKAWKKERASRVSPNTKSQGKQKSARSG